MIPALKEKIMCVVRAFFFWKIVKAFLFYKDTLILEHLLNTININVFIGLDKIK